MSSDHGLQACSQQEYLRRIYLGNFTALDIHGGSIARHIGVEGVRPLDLIRWSIVARSMARSN